MSLALQGSLFDEPHTPDGPRLGPLAGHLRRTQLGRGAWVEVRTGWLTGADRLFLDLVEQVPWRAERRQMYDRVVDVPRLLAFYDEDATPPHPVLGEAREQLSGHYAEELGEPFATSGLCYYRDGRDSVAWHGDTIGRGSTQDTMVAIVSLGETRRLLLRPRGPGTSLSFALGHGDLLVMGGSCQRTWEHCVPKSARPCGPRISIQLRPRGVR